jgi:hypothetical protein
MIIDLITSKNESRIAVVFQYVRDHLTDHPLGDWWLVIAGS